MKIIDSFHDTINLFKSTFHIIAKNKKIIKPTIQQLIFGGAFLFLIILGLIFTFMPSTAFLGFILLGIGAFLLVFFYPFLKTYYKSAQVWITYKTFKGEMVTYKDGIARAKQNKGDIAAITFFSFIASFLANKMRNQKGILGVLLGFLSKIVEEGWDLVSHYLLPACIIQEKGVMEVIKELKDIRRNIPGTLAGVFGLDFAGDMVGGYLGIFMIVIGLPLLFIGWPAYLIWIAFTVLVGVILRVFVDMMKTVYFTLFYMSVEMPMEISEDHRQNVTKYLLHQKPTNLEEPPIDKGAQLAKVIPYVLKYREQGHTDAEISSFLVQYGWPQDLVAEAILRSRRG